MNLLDPSRFFFVFLYRFIGLNVVLVELFFIFKV